MVKMTSWQTKTIGELVDYEQPSKYLVKDTNYIEDGTPVLTANKAFVLGYTHETEGIYVCSKDSPVIIFDDFTTDNKFVNFDFKVKSSAIKILTVKPSNALPRFVHGAMQLIKTDITEHKRRFISEYQFHPIDTPELAEQERIVGVLEVWDEYIEKLEQKIALKEQLKKGLMQQLLTGKVRLTGMQQYRKEYKLGDLLEVLTDYTANGSFASLKDNVRYFSSSEYAALVRTTDLEKKIFEPMRFTNKRGYDYLKKTSLHGGELIMSNVGNIGKVYRVPNYDGLMTLAPNTYLIKFIDTFVDSNYIFQLMRTSGFRNKVLKMVGGGEGGGLVAINKANFRSIKVTIPELEMQKEIANILETADREIESLNGLKKFVFFQKKYLLKNLITGAIRTPEDLKPLDTTRLERSAL